MFQLCVDVFFSLFICIFIRETEVVTYDKLSPHFDLQQRVSIVSKITPV